MFKEEKSEIEMSKELVELNSIEIIKNMLIDYDKNFEYYGNFPTLNLERKKAIDVVLNILENQKAEIEKKDKIIDLMAEEILYENNCSGELDFEIYKDKEEVIKYFEKKAEEDK